MTWDAQLLSLLNQDLAHPLLDVLLAALTLAAMPALAGLPLLLLAMRKRWAGLAMLGVLVLNMILTVGFQFAFMRPRPGEVRLVLPTSAFPSFPSGHAAGAFGCATLAALIWPRLRWPALFGATLISLTRVYLGLHYPSDVIGGAILGMATAVVVYRFYRSKDETRSYLRDKSNRGPLSLASVTAERRSRPRRNIGPTKPMLLPGERQCPVAQHHRPEPAATRETHERQGKCQTDRPGDRLA
jgi:undecaprenyl-diphosphatase